MNTLYAIDPDDELAVNKNAGSLVGDSTLFADGSGDVSLQIGQNNLGVRNHRRHFLAEHSVAAGVEAVYVIADTSDDGTFWQFNTLETNVIATDAPSLTYRLEGTTDFETFDRITETTRVPDRDLPAGLEWVEARITPGSERYFLRITVEMME